MKVGSIAGDSAGNKRAGLTAMTVFFMCCMVFSSALLAQETPKTETPVAAAEADSGAEEGSNSVEEEAQVDVKAELEAILKKNARCLRCHNRDKSKTLEDGESMSIQVHRDVYLASAHGEVSCVGCHTAIGNRKHPSKSTNISITNQRDYTVEMNDSCRACHKEKFTQYKGSVHAALVAQGSPKAPVCTSCHSAHAVETMEDYHVTTGFPCKECHEGIFNAYASSVHGEARINGNTIRDSHIQSPICSDCHKSHEVTALGIGDPVRTTCIGCHENVVLLHTQWLPNAGTHLDIVSCAVCHAPFAKHKFDLHLYDNVAQSPVTQSEGEEPLQEQLQAIAAEGGDADPFEVWKQRGGMDQQGQAADISLRSRMEVMSGVAAHQIANKNFAVRTCDSCHEPGSRQNQNVTVSIPQSDGRRQTFEADREALSNVEAVSSVSDFYALRGDPNKLLDYMVLLSLLAGIAVPVGHFTLGKMLKEKMERGEQ